jgi:hypothetical protein
MSTERQTDAADARPVRPVVISVPLPAWTPIAMGVAFAALYFIFYHALGFGVSPNDLSVVISTESRSRTLYGATVAILAVALLWNYLLAIAIFLPHLPWIPSWRGLPLHHIFYGLLILVLTALAACAGLHFNFAGAAADSLLHCISDTGVETVTGLMNGFGIFTIFALTVALYYLTEKSREDVTEEIVARVRYFTILVYSGGALLGLGVFEVYALYDWAAVSVADIYQAKARDYAVTTTLDFGFLYSSLMVIVYLPVAQVQESRLKKKFVAAAAGDKTLTMKTWLSAQGLSFAPFSFGGSFAAIAVPVLTGVLTKFLQA